MAWQAQATHVVQHGSRDGEPHAPSAGQLPHARRLERGRKAHSVERRINLGGAARCSGACDRARGAHEVRHRLVALRQHLVLHVHHAKRGREAGDVTGRNAREQRRLAHAVLAHQRVAAAATQRQVAGLH